jgi:prepilin-type N-terminal cleavage/methylation domain-containing protein
MSMSHQRGFSLLEMSVVLVIAALLLGGVLKGTAGLQARERDAATLRQLEEIREALGTFAALNRRLPCPANPATAATAPGAGVERVPTATGCTGGNHGVLPWATLGLPQTDAWGRRFTYRVTASLARSGTAITLASAGDNVVRNMAGVDLATQVPAVIVSHGANARGSFATTGAAAAGGTDPSELENADADAQFTSNTPTAQFDDHVSWLPISVLMSRMLQAGALP